MKLPLEKARLCLECDTIHDQVSCPQCGSATFFYLANWVKPRPEPEPAPPLPGASRSGGPPEPPRFQMLPRRKRHLLRNTLLAGASLVAAYGLLFRPAKKKVKNGESNEGAS